MALVELDETAAAEATGYEDAVVASLRAGGAAFAYVHGSRATGQERAGSDLDVAAYFGEPVPSSWDVPLPAGVDLLVLDTAPLYLAGRVALAGRLLFDDDPPTRVAWEADTRTVYLDERPFIEQMAHEYLDALADRGRR